VAGEQTTTAVPTQPERLIGREEERWIRPAPATMK